MASANTRETIIALNIFGADDGFLPKAFIEAKPIAAMTADGPSIVTNITRIIIRFRISAPLKLKVQSLLHLLKPVIQASVY